MKRFASLDFLRGIAITLMIVLHQIADMLDINGMMDEINDLAFINVVALVIVPFLGSLAGLFLLVSAIGNSVSMTKYLMKGNSVNMLALKQFLGGFILYLFAMLSEGTIGYYGAIGGLARRLNNPLIINWDTSLTRWGNFETIHTIAWCIMINGPIHALLSRRNGWKNPKKQMLIYGILTIAIVAATPFVWQAVTKIIPGFPWGKTAEGYTLYMPHFIDSSFIEIIQGAFFGALAAPMEPIFPYLGVSFIGTMIGIGLAQPEKGIFKHFSRWWLLIGLAMFLIGAAGTASTIVKLMEAENFDYAVAVYRHLPYHRNWSPDYFSSLSWLSYLWQFLVTNGFALICTMVCLNIIEFRGRGQKFGEKTKFIRRFGFLAFTCYNMQYIYPIVNFFIPQFMGLEAYGKTRWVGTFIQILTTVSIYHMILSVWEKANYRGSLEWFIIFIASFLIPNKRNSKEEKRTWKARGDLVVDGGFYNVEWINLVEEDNTYHAQKRDSSTAYQFAIWSLAIPLFVPFSCGNIFITLKARKIEGINKKNTVALILSIIGVVFTLAFTIFVFTVAPINFGIAL